ncbi:hypothetical protein LCI18_013120 [Fusarium solani-melongenae]|uniref:Uncharacterized protein n=1 Tax=Fusarium solani subsp. cucurbitae TaxID=2747967 RepID=A0ACD3ZLS0_FUSSC|nr:hypothetical protein LCI18_013120 [Fusarium solani-melongenae]
MPPKRTSTEDSEGPRKAAKTTNSTNDTANHDDPQELTRRFIAKGIGISSDDVVLRREDEVDTTSIGLELASVLKTKAEYPNRTYKALTRIAFQVIGRDPADHSELVDKIIERMKSTRLLERTFAQWSGHRKTCDLLRTASTMCRTWRDYIFVPAAQFTIPPFIALYLLKNYCQTRGDNSKLMARRNAFRYLGRSIDKWESMKDYQIMLIGQRPDDEPFNPADVAMPGLLIPGPGLVNTPNLMALTPYPSSTNFVTVRKEIKSEDWVSINWDWLEKLGDRRIDGASFKGKIEQQVTAQTAPLIPEVYRDKLWAWFGEFNKEGRKLIEVDFQSSVQIKTEVESLVRSDDPTLLKELPDTCIHGTLAIKEQINRLFAYREAENSENQRWKNEIQQTSRFMVEAASKLPILEASVMNSMIQRVEKHRQETIQKLEKEVNEKWDAVDVSGATSPENAVELMSELKEDFDMTDDDIRDWIQLGEGIRGMKDSPDNSLTFAHFKKIAMTVRGNALLALVRYDQKQASNGAEKPV